MAFDNTFFAFLALLIFLGILVLIDSVVEEGPKVSKFHFRPLIFIAISSLAFAYLLKPLGLVIATAILIIGLSAVSNLIFVSISSNGPMRNPPISFMARSMV